MPVNNSPLHNVTLDAFSSLVTRPTCGDSLSVSKKNQLNSDVRIPNRLQQPGKGLVRQVWQVSIENSFIFATLFLEVYKCALSSCALMPPGNNLHYFHSVANIRILSTRNSQYVSISTVDLFCSKSVLHMWHSSHPTSQSMKQLQQIMISKLPDFVSEGDASLCQLLCFLNDNSTPTTLHL
jgi:hypothetical protein